MCFCVFTSVDLPFLPAWFPPSRIFHMPLPHTPITPPPTTQRHHTAWITEGHGRRKRRKNTEPHHALPPVSVYVKQLGISISFLSLEIVLFVK